MAVDLGDLLDPACIELELEGKRKPDIIRELVNIISRCSDHIDHEELYDALMCRENISSTGVGDGIAIPHCLIPKVEKTQIAFGRKLDGAKFDAVDNKPVSLFFLLVGPEGNPTHHLQVLSKLARYLHDPIFCQKLLDADSVEEVVEAVRSKDRG
ncbi:PTS sugar transporter subunit IIA [Candidatus Fermentibacteria bacterium]|nr:PTS sugar transporter subunit IIA [Candidatus Fermentibacteria bacterium]